VKPSVLDFFVEFTAPLEGTVFSLYADVKNLITVGIGNLVDASPAISPWLPAIGLPFVHPGGALATTTEITRAWLAVKGDPKSATHGWSYAAMIPGNEIRMTAAGVAELVRGKLRANDASLLGRYPDWESYPADAQLAIHSLAWACGPAYRFPALDAALKAREFDECAVHIKMNTAGNPGLVPRNANNRTLMMNAMFVESLGLDADALYFPRVLTANDASTYGHESPVYSEPTSADRPTTWPKPDPPDEAA